MWGFFLSKKHCEKHDQFDYNCKDCQEAARNYAKGGSEEEDKIKPIRPHVDIDEEYKEVKEERYRYVKIQDKKYRISSSKIKKYSRIVVPVIILTITLLTIFIFWPLWHGGISLQAQLYSLKAGGLNYYDVFFLNYWSTNFFLNKTALFTAIVGCIIMSIPPNRNLLTIIGTKFRFGKPSVGKSLIFWWTLGFLIFYILGFVIGSLGDFAWVMYLIENGQIQISITVITDSFAVLFNPNSMNFESIFIYTGLILPIIIFVIGVFIARGALNIASNYYLRRNDYKILTNGLLIAGLSCGIGFFILPIFALNGIELIQIWALIILFGAFIFLGLFSYIYGKKKVSNDKRNYKILIPQAKKIGIVCGIVIIIAVMPLFLSIGPSLSLNNLATWTDMQWNRHDSRTIAWTQECAGLDMFEERTIENFTASTITNDTEIISQIRQYDQDYAVPILAAKLGTTWEGLADSDIVYINGSEYWVSPKTLKVGEIAGDVINTYTELYDHVEGFLALDTFTGDIVNVTQTFNMSETYPIFFGEHERNYASGAYDSDILLGTGWAGEIEKNDHVYEGVADGTLVGAEAFWYSINLGLIAYASLPSAQYLINRNIKTRVQNILLPHLRIDNDPYLVFDKEHGKMYYAVSIFTSISIGSYSKTPIYRFLGTCLVDVMTGDMNFYKNPSLGTAAVLQSTDPTYNLWKIYMTKYNWQSVPTWLMDQLRYPETLFELQLAAYYRYHVTDPTTWKRGDDFHERPENGDLFYIETDLGEGIEYVGLDLVEYYGQEAFTLAGMYVVRHGDHFGEAIFYHTRSASEKLIGPKIARDTYAAEATDEIYTITGARQGNTLLYPLGGSIYYYIPTYSDVNSIQNLELTGFVEAFTRDVGYGDDVLIAYENLGISGPGTFTLTTDADPIDADGIFNLTWMASNNADSYSVYRDNQTITEINANLTLVDSGVTELTYSTSAPNGTWYYIVQATNIYGNATSNCIEIIVALPPPISYEFIMESTLAYPDDLAYFRFEVENINTNITAPGYDIVLNLTLYRSGGGNFSLVGIPSRYLPISNYTFSDGITFTLLNLTIDPNDGTIGGGYVSCPDADIVIHYTWDLFIDAELIYSKGGTIITSS